MAYGHGGFGGGMNMNALMNQARKMQEQMQKAQEELEQAEVVGKAGGKGEFKSIKLDKTAVDPDDVEMLEDLILVAVKDAQTKVEELKNSKMGGMAGGMGGLF